MANEYDDLIQEEKREALRQSMFVASKQQPDTEAKLQMLSARTGVPLDAIRLTAPEVEIHDRLQSFDYEKVLKDSPRLSAWMADPKNAGVSSDDWENLSRTEKLFTHAKDYLGAAAKGVVGDLAGSIVSGTSSFLDVGARAIDRPVRDVFGDRVADMFWYEPAKINGVSIDPLSGLKTTGQNLKRLGEFLGPPKERQTLGTDVAAGTGQLAGQIALFLITGGTATAAQLLMQGTDVMTEKVAKDISDPALKDSAIIVGAGVTPLLERLGMDAILNRVPPEIRNRTLRFIADKVAAGGIEAAQEFVEALLQDTARYVFSNRDAPILEGVTREMSAAGLSAAIVRTALGVRGYNRAKQTEDFFKALGDQAGASKLRERMPERFKELVEKYTEDGPLRQVFVPADKFVEYFQSQNIDPGQMAVELGVSNLKEAVVANSDVVIPMADFAARIAPTDHLQGLMPDLRLRQDEMTAREVKEAKAEAEERAAEIQEELRQINSLAEQEGRLSDAVQQIVGNVEQQLAKRYTPDTAKQLATAMRGIAVLAQRANPGADPVAAAQNLWSRYGLNIDSNGASLNNTGQEFAQHIVDQASELSQGVPKKGEAGPSEKRGSFRIAPDRTMQISLFEKANLSTFLHETGHFYLEVLGDLAEAEGTSQQVKDDYAKSLAFLGVASREEIKVEHHEKWARANEAYMMEGRAPSPELRGVFRRFQAWMKLIYRQLQSLDVKLTDDVRGVFDRIYATDAEIEQAVQDAKLQPLFLDAKTAQMTEVEFEAYRDVIAERTEDAKDALQIKLMRIEKLKRESWWKEERAKIAEKLAEDFDAQPAAQAFSTLTSTESGTKLNKTQLVERYGFDAVKAMPRGYGQGFGAIYSDDGIDIDAAAEIFGYGDADSMILSIKNLPNRSRFIASESNRIMSEQHGDLLNDIAIAEAAMEALHNEKREQVLKIEIRALNKRVRDVAPIVKFERRKAQEELVQEKKERAYERRFLEAEKTSLDAARKKQALEVARMPQPAQLRDMAAGIVSTKQVRELSPASYLIAERKASKAAFEAMAKEDFLSAMVEKNRELLNHYLYLESSRAKSEATKIRNHLDGLAKDKRRAEIGKAGHDYLDQIDAILEQYEFKKVSLTEIGRRESLAAWIERQEEEGNAVSIPQNLIDSSRQVNWKQVSIDDLRGIYDAVRNIEHLARLKNKLIRKGVQLDFEIVKQSLLDGINNSNFKSTGELETPNIKGASIKEKGAAAWLKFDAAHLKIEQLVEWLDGGDIAGAWAKNFFDLADHAQTLEYDLHAEVTNEIQKINDSMPKQWRESLLDRTTLRLPGFSKPLTRYDLISVAMNMGNAQNMQRLRDGYGWTENDFNTIKQTLRGDDMRFVQGMWDAIEKLWPHMAALEKRVSGLEPEKVLAQEIEIADTVWRGGYFPLVYDPRKSGFGEKQADETESVQQFMAKGYGRAATNKGATKARVDELKAPVLLDYEQVLTSHVAKVIKDISHREAVMSFNKILKDKDVKEALIDRLGEAKYQQMNKWVQRLVNDRADSLHQTSGLAGFLMKARTNTAIVTMGWKISTMLAQGAGYFSAMDNVKPQFLMSASVQFAMSPKITWGMVQEKSGEMRHRADTLERDVKDALLRMRGEEGLSADVRRTAFFLTSMADRAISTQVWVGGYNQALAEGKAEEDAIRAGDRAVRLSQGAGGAKDLSAVQGSNELMRLLTMYYTPFNVLYARLRDVGHQASIKGIGYLPAAVARSIALVILPAILGDLLAGRGPDDEEDATWWAIRKSLLYPLASIPVLRDFSGYLEAAIIGISGEGEMKFPPNYKLSPIVGAIEKIAKAPGKVVSAIEGDKEADDVAWDIFESSGIVLGLPTAQPRITGEYIFDLISGDADPENAPDMLRDMLFRRDKK